MPSSRFTIRGLIVVVVAFGVCFASLRTPSPIWEGVAATVCLGCVAFSLIAGLCQGPGRERDFWRGFAFGSLLPLALSSGPFLDDTIGPKLLSTALLDLSYAHVARPRIETIPEMPLQKAGSGPISFGMRIVDDTQIRNRYESLGLHYDYFGWGASTPIHGEMSYLRIGHFWFALLLGTLGGRLAVRFRAMDRSEGGVAA